MLGLLLFVISVTVMGAGISYDSQGIVWTGFMVLIWSLYEVGKIR